MTIFRMRCSHARQLQECSSFRVPSGRSVMMSVASFGYFPVEKNPVPLKKWTLFLSLSHFHTSFIWLFYIAVWWQHLLFFTCSAIEDKNTRSVTVIDNGMRRKLRQKEKEKKNSWKTPVGIFIAITRVSSAYSTCLNVVITCFRYGHCLIKVRINHCLQCPTRNMTLTGLILEYCCPCKRSERGFKTIMSHRKTHLKGCSKTKALIHRDITVLRLIYQTINHGSPNRLRTLLTKFPGPYTRIFPAVYVCQPK